MNTRVSDSDKRWPQFELKVVRESASSVASRENEAFTGEENINETRAQGLHNIAEKDESCEKYSEKNRNQSMNESKGKRQDVRCDTKQTQELNISQLKTSAQVIVGFSVVV